jgi:cytochrome c oxidase subunit IV
MPDGADRRKNLAPWWGLLFALAAIGCNVAFFASPPLQGALPWLSLVFAILALVFLAAGLRRAFGQAQIYGGKVLSVVLTVIALLPLGITAFAFVKARELPGSTAAPQVGQRVPDFTLLDTSGKPISLDQLLAPAGSASTSESQAQAPKAVLLIFYRGYW